MGGAHRNPAATAAALGKAIGEELRALSGKPPTSLREMRAERFLRIGT
jgi:acetyl-CoA carboxylase carboxyl transferase subunit alpha